MRQVLYDESDSQTSRKGPYGMLEMEAKKREGTLFRKPIQLEAKALNSFQPPSLKERDC